MEGGVQGGWANLIKNQIGKYPAEKVAVDDFNVFVPLVVL